MLQSPTIKGKIDSWDIRIQFHALLIFLTLLSLAPTAVRAVSHLTGICEPEHIKD